MSKLRAPSPPGMSSTGHSAAEGTVHQDKQQVRFTAILTDLQQTGRVSVETLSEQLDVSVVTIRRDLDELEQKGLLRRTHGGAVSIEPLFYELFRRDQSFLAQVERAADEKRRIGRAAAALINPGETIALTPGTTTTEVIRGPADELQHHGSDEHSQRSDGTFQAQGRLCFRDRRTSARRMVLSGRFRGLEGTGKHVD